MIARGILRYAAAREHWRVRGAADRLPTSRAFDGAAVADGAIGSAWAIDQLRDIKARGGCVVMVSDRLADMTVPRVVPDNVAVGRLAAEHLLRRRFRSFAYAGAPNRVSLLRRQGFAEVVERAGQVVVDLPVQEAVEDGRRSVTVAAADLRKLPRGTGVLCVNDRTAADLMDQARWAGIRLPEDLGVVGVDNDELICLSMQPALTSVAPPMETVGIRAGELLDAMMAGDPPPPGPVLVEPSRLVERSSTETVTADDSALAEALKLIRDANGEPPSVAAVAKAVGVSRRTLELRMRRHLGHSPQTEIRRVQCQRAKRLLEATTLPLAEVARRCHFSSEAYFSQVFLRVTGVRPGEYRKRR